MLIHYPFIIWLSLIYHSVFFRDRHIRFLDLALLLISCVHLASGFPSIKWVTTPLKAVKRFKPNEVHGALFPTWPSGFLFSVSRAPQRALMNYPPRGLQSWFCWWVKEDSECSSGKAGTHVKSELEPEERGSSFLSTASPTMFVSWSSEVRANFWPLARPLQFELQSCT